MAFEPDGKRGASGPGPSMITTAPFVPRAMGLPTDDLIQDRHLDAVVRISRASPGGSGSIHSPSESSTPTLSSSQRVR
jgi:hypothetical protein